MYWKRFAFAPSVHAFCHRRTLAKPEEPPAGRMAEDRIDMIAKYPQADKDAVDTGAENIIESVIDITRAIRNIRAENKVDPTKWIAADIYSGKLAAAIIPYASAIQSLAKVKPLEFKGRSGDRSPERKVCGRRVERS